MNAHQPSGLRHIWLCADDYGISAGVNTAIRDLIVRGRLNATSVLVAAPSFNRFEAQALNALNSGTPRVAIGLHFALDGAVPAAERGLRAAARRRIPAARRHADRGHAVAASTRTRWRPRSRAQLEAFRAAFGRAPDFIDGHQHVHLFPQVSEAVLDVAKELAPDAWLRQCGRASPLAGAARQSQGAAARRA